MSSIHDILENTDKELEKLKRIPMRDPLLLEREITHGSFTRNAQIFGQLTTPMSNDIPQGSAHYLALIMISVKLSRILSGQANFKDHWDDIAGYAKLGSEACES